MTTRKLTCLLLLLCWMLPHLLMSNRWVHGSLYLPVLQEGYEISQFSGHPLSIEEEAAVLPASIRIIGKAQEGLLLAGSNGLRLCFRGPGSLAFERFEQQVSGNRLAGKSRSILSMNTGRVEVDSRALANESKLIFELPIGQVQMDHALGLIEIRYSSRSRIYSFEIDCLQGTVLFADRSGRDYRIEAGQTLTGAGDSFEPSLEISDLTGSVQDKLAAFVQNCNRGLKSIEDNPQLFFQEMIEVRNNDRKKKRSESMPADVNDGSEPYIIEFSANPSLLIPRYGVAGQLSPSEKE